MAKTYKITCRGCDSTWTAKTWAHCSVCHATFTGVTYFDYHRVNGKCWGASDNALRHSQLTLSDGVWSTPEGHENRRVQSDRARNARRGKTAVAESSPDSAAVAKPRVSPESIKNWAHESAVASFRLSGLIE